MPSPFAPAARRALALAALAALRALPAQPAPAPAPLTLERILATPALAGTAPAAPAWSPDARHLAFLWNDRALPARDLWVVARGDSAPRRLTRGEAGVATFRWANATTLVFLRAGDLWRLTLGGAEAERLTRDGGDKGALEPSPDGRWYAWLRDGDLWLLPAAGGTPERVTALGIPPLSDLALGTYHRPDREVGEATWGGGAPAYAWSPDGRTIALHVVDRRHVRRTAFPYYLRDTAAMHVLRRSFPGDRNEERTLHFLDVASRRLAPIALEGSEERRVVDFAWSPAGELLVDRESDDAEQRWLHVAAPGRPARELWHDARATRVYTDIGSAWHPDGRRVVMTSDLEDRYRLFVLGPGEAAPRPLTDAASDVAGPPIAVPATGALYYLSTDPSPAERHVWRVDARGRRERLTTRPGHYVPVVSPDGGAVAYLFSDDVTPPELYLADAAPGAPMRQVTHSPPADFARVPWVRPRYVAVPQPSGPPLHLRIFEPPGRDPARRSPVLFGPVYSNTVRNRWGGTYGMVQQLLALARGYIVVQVDVRGSTGYGRAFREAFLMDWGGGDLDDLEQAVRYMASLPQVDPARMGIWGSSYGGTLTVYSLLRKPGLFRAGVAGAPAVDPRYFGSDDVAIARRPQSHPDTFRRGAAQWAGNLRDHLLIIHGMEDDVVPFQTTVQLAEALMQAGKDFDVAFAPAATHGWTQRPHYARYLLQRLLDHFDRHLGPAQP